MEDFYKKYCLGVRGFVAKKIDDEGVVEEITNDVMLAAITSFGSFEGKSSEFSWICSIAKHKVVDYFRKKKLKTVLFSVSPVFEEIADQSLNPERDVLKNELKEEIKKTFKEIGAGYKKILRLKYIDGWKVSEIAKKTKTTMKSVESKLTRAKKQFREAWVYDQKKN